MSTEAPILFPLAGRRVWVAGHRGMVGSAIVRRLETEDCEVVVAGRETLDLTRQDDVLNWMQDVRPAAVFLAAAKVGGILANDNFPADFIHQNLMIEANVIDAAHRAGVAKLLLLGSSCVYPKFAAQPIKEESLLTGPLEPTNEWYAIAKIAGIKMAQAYRKQHGCDFISAMPTNLYGPGDNYDLNSSHVIPALLRKAHVAERSGAERMTIWGTGSPLREFLHADDCADACVFLMKHFSGPTPLNIGSGDELSILELATLIGQVVGFEGVIDTDPTKPDGTPRKRLDTGELDTLGWRRRIPIAQGLAETYRGFVELETERDRQGPTADARAARKI